MEWERYRIHSSHGCHCTECFPCTCGAAYTREGKLKLIIEEHNDSPIQECGLQCDCPPQCPNRVLQRGTIVALEVREAGDKGMGLFAAEPITAGSFVIEYRGDFIPKDSQGPYVLQVKEHTSQGILVTTLDGSPLENTARYINHSCDPNMLPQPVRISHALPHIGLFSLCEIAVGEELTFNYNRGIGVECKCGSEKCIGKY